MNKNKESIDIYDDAEDLLSTTRFELEDLSDKARKLCNIYLSNALEKAAESVKIAEGEVAISFVNEIRDGYITVDKENDT